MGQPIFGVEIVLKRYRAVDRALKVDAQLGMQNVIIIIKLSLIEA